MKVYLINLDSETLRLEVVDSMLKRLKVTYERISAVRGITLASAEKKRSVNNFRWWCAVGRPVRDGEIGCALSHYAIYSKMGNKPVCVLEDDVILDERFVSVLEFVSAFVDPKKSQVVLLSNHTKVCAMSEGFSVQPAKSDKYAEGYVITPKAAKALLMANLPMQCPCDWWGRWARLGIIELYHAFPSVCRQDQSRYESGTIGQDCFRVADLGLVQFCFHKVKRLLGKMIDVLLLGVGV